jgi:hypothetical protein
VRKVLFEKGPLVVGPAQMVYMQSSPLPLGDGQKPLPSSKVMNRAALVFLKVLLFRMLGTRPPR